ncbi:hypothetical protein Droror1_Dr00027855, partial [Drosera rotundifolia]
MSQLKKERRSIHYYYTGLSLGVPNVAIVIPQMPVSLISGPLDALFGGGNSPAFALGAQLET